MNRFLSQPAGTRSVGRQSTGTRATGTRATIMRARLGAAALALAALAVVAGCTPAARPPAPAASGTAAAAHAPRASASSTASTAVAPCNPYASSLKPPPGPPQDLITPDSSMAAIKKRGYLVAGVDANTYKFEYFNPRDGNFEGFDIDMIQAVARAIFGSDITGRIQYKAITDDARKTDLINGTVDIVAHTYTIKCSRLNQVDFSIVYFDAHGQILVLDNSTVNSVSDLRGQKVCATAGSDSLGNIEAYKPKIVPPVVPVIVPFITDCLVMLQQGQVAAITSDNSILQGLKDQDPYTKILPGYLTDEPYGLAVAKDQPDFVRFVNAVLLQEEADGAWKASYVNWVGSPAPQPPTVEGYAG